MDMMMGRGLGRSPNRFSVRGAGFPRYARRPLAENGLRGYLRRAIASDHRIIFDAVYPRYCAGFRVSRVLYPRRCARVAVFASAKRRTMTRLCFVARRLVARHHGSKSKTPTPFPASA